MTKLQFKYIIILILSIFLITNKKSNACSSGPDPEYYHFQLFNNTIGLPLYWASYFSDYYELYSVKYKNGEYIYPNIPRELSQYNENLKVWATKLNYKYSLDTLYYIIYTSKIDEIITPIGQIKDSTTIFYKIYLENTEFYKYLLFAKKNEILLNTSSPWNTSSFYSTENFDTLRINEQINIALDKSKNLKDPFYANRYAYQALVLNYYLKKYNKVLEIYKRDLEPSTEEFLKNWALIYVAKIQQNNGDKLNAQKMFLKIFKNAPAKRKAAEILIDLNYLDTKQSQLSKNELFTLKILNMTNWYSSKNNLDELLKENPNSELVKFVINKKLQIFNNKYRNYLNENIEINKYQKLYSDFKNSLNTYIYKLTSYKNSFKDRAYINLILSYLYALKGDTETAQRYNQTAKIYIKDSEYLYQYKSNNLLIEIISLNKYYPNLTLKITNDLEDFYKSNLTIKPYESHFKNAFNLLLANYYIKNKNYAHAIAVLSDINYYRDPKLFLDQNGTINDAVEYLNILKNPQGYIEQKYIKSNDTNSIYKIEELIGTFALRNDDFETAIKYYEQVPPKYRQEICASDYNPFHLFKDPADKTPKIDTTMTDKLNFTKKLYSLIQSTKKLEGDKKAEAYRRIAIAYQNMSYSGKKWGYVAYGKSIWINNTYFNQDHINKNYFTCIKSIEYFNKALNYVQTEKLKNEILYGKFLAQNRQDIIIGNFEEKEAYKDYYKLIEEIKLKTPKLAEIYEKECPDLQIASPYF